MRPTVKFDVEGLGSFEVIASPPTMQELNEIESGLVNFFGADDYYGLIEKVAELQSYRRTKNEEALTPDGYKALLKEYQDAIKESADVIGKADDEKLVAINKRLTDIDSRFYFDGKIGILNSLQDRLAQAREIVTTNVLITSPADFDSGKLSEPDYIKFRQALEDCLRKFRNKGETAKAQETNRLGAEGAATKQ